MLLIAINYDVLISSRVVETGREKKKRHSEGFLILLPNTYEPSMSRLSSLLQFDLVIYNLDLITRSFPDYIIHRDLRGLALTTDFLCTKSE